MWPDTNSNRGMVNTFFANLALDDATSPWLTHFSCTTKAYTAAATPFPLASPKACNLPMQCGEHEDMLFLALLFYTIF